MIYNHSSDLDGYRPQPDPGLEPDPDPALTGCDCLDLPCLNHGHGPGPDHSQPELNLTDCPDQGLATKDSGLGSRVGDGIRGGIGSKADISNFPLDSLDYVKPNNDQHSGVWLGEEKHDLTQPKSRGCHGATGYRGVGVKGKGKIWPLGQNWSGVRVKNRGKQVEGGSSFSCKAKVGLKQGVTEFHTRRGGGKKMGVPVSHTPNSPTHLAQLAQPKNLGVILGDGENLAINRAGTHSSAWDKTGVGGG